MKHNYYIESEQIIVKPMNSQDIEKYRILRNRKDNIFYFFSNKEITVDEQKAWYEKYLVDDKQLMFSIKEKSSGAFVGGAGIYNIDTNVGMAEIGRIIVDREIASGRHYGCEAIKLISTLASEKLNLSRLYATIYSFNIASIKSFKMAGYKETTVSEEILKMEIVLDKI